MADSRSASTSDMSNDPHKSSEASEYLLSSGNANKRIKTNESASQSPALGQDHHPCSDRYSQLNASRQPRTLGRSIQGPPGPTGSMIRLTAVPTDLDTRLHSASDGGIDRSTTPFYVPEHLAPITSLKRKKPEDEESDCPRED